MNKLLIILLIFTISTLKANLIYDTFDSPKNYILATNYSDKNPYNSKLAYKISLSKFYNLDNVKSVNIDKIQLRVKSVFFQDIFKYDFNSIQNHKDIRNLKVNKNTSFKLSFYKDINNKLSDINLFDLDIKKFRYEADKEILTIILDKKITLENQNYWLVFNFDNPNQKNLYFFGVNNLSKFDDDLLFNNSGLKFQTKDEFIKTKNYNNLNLRLFGTVSFKDMSKFDFKTKIDVFEDYTLLSINLEDNNKIKVELFDYKGMFVSNKDLPEYEYFFKVSLNDENFVKSFKISKEGKELKNLNTVFSKDTEIIKPIIIKKDTVGANPSVRPITKKKIDYKFLLPGMVQFKTNKTKSFLLGMSFVGCSVFSITSLSSHYDTMDSYNTILKSYRLNPNPSTRDELQTTLNDANSFYDRYLFFSISALLIYSYNVFDYFYFDYYKIKTTPTVNIQNKSIGLQMNFNL